MSFSWKQKTNSKSSKESELIGVDDTLPQIFWTRYFMENQIKLKIIFCSKTIKCNVIRKKWQDIQFKKN